MKHSGEGVVIEDIEDHGGLDHGLDGLDFAAKGAHQDVGGPLSSGASVDMWSLLINDQRGAVVEGLRRDVGVKIVGDDDGNAGECEADSAEGFLIGLREVFGDHSAVEGEEDGVEFLRLQGTNEFSDEGFVDGLRYWPFGSGGAIEPLNDFDVFFFSKDIKEAGDFVLLGVEEGTPVGGGARDKSEVGALGEMPVEGVGLVHQHGDADGLGLNGGGEQKVRHKQAH